MLAALQTWFSEQLPNRRLYPRRNGPFRVWIGVNGEWAPLIGLDIAAGGIGVASLVPLPWGSTPFAAEITERRVEFHGKSVWLQEGRLEGRHVWRGGFRIGSIGAEDWRTILDYCNASLPAEQQVLEPPVLRVPPYDVERLLPEELRERVVEVLVQADRLTFLGTHPNLQFSYGGVVHREGDLRHKLCVVSHAMTRDNRVQTHESVIYFSDDLSDVSL